VRAEYQTQWSPVLINKLYCTDLNRCYTFWEKEDSTKEFNTSQRNIC